MSGGLEMNLRKGECKKVQRCLAAKIAQGLGIEAAQGYNLNPVYHWHQLHLPMEHEMMEVVRIALGEIVRGREKADMF